MIKITVEELDIIVQASVEQALTEFKKMVPQLKKTMKQVEDNLNNVDTKGMVIKVQQAVQQVKQKVNEVKSTGIDKQLQSQFEKAGASVEKYQGQLDQLKEKLRQVYADMDTRQNQKWQEYTPDGLDINKNPKVAQAIEPVVNDALASDKTYQNLSKQASKLEQQIQSLNSKLNNTKQEYNQIAGQIQEATSKQSIWSNIIDKIKNSMAGLKKNMSSVVNAFQSASNISQKVKSGCNQISKVTGSVVTKVKQIGTGFKQGLGHVLKYAGALFSLQTIYSTLSGAANAWLSSQNAGAQQLSANIDYMKYALGSALAPVIQFVTNLVYQLLKAIQSVVYALTGVNIFANASAKAYSNMADSAKKANKETKQLAGVHDEINNIQETNPEGGNSGGSVAPNIDLSEAEGIDSTIIDAIKNGNWYEIGTIIGEKLNEAMNNIPWDKIQEGARKIGTGIAKFLNGFIATADWTQVGNTLAQGLNTVIYFGYSFVTTFDWAQFGQAIGSAINGFFNNIDWNTLSLTISNGLNGIFTYIHNFFTTVDWSGIASNLVNGLNNAISNIDWSLIGTTISDGANAIIDFLYTTVSEFDWLGLGISLANSVNNAFAGIDWSQAGQTLSNAITGLLWSAISFLAEVDWYQLGKSIGDFLANIDWMTIIGQLLTILCEAAYALIMALAGFLEGIFTGIGNWLYTNLVEPCISIFSELWAGIQEIFANIGQWFKEKFQQAYDGIVSIFQGIGQWFSDRWNDICNVFGNIGSWFKGKFQDAYNSITNIFSKIGNFFSGIWNNIKNTFSNLGTNIGNAISNAVKSGINGVISLIQNTINKAIGLINGAIGLINLLPGVSVGKISTITLPRLATGAVLKVPTIAEMAEYPGASQNPEIVTPQNIMEETFDRVMSRYQDNNNSQPIYLTVNVGNKKLGQILLDDLKDRKRRTGSGIEALVGG